MRLFASALLAVLTALPATGGAATVDTVLYQGMKWRDIGPFRGGRSVAVAGVVSQPRTFYFGGVGGGVWKTGDAGESWANVTDGQLATSSVGALAVAPSDPNVVYVGMGEHAVRGVMTSLGDGVYRSTDAGKTWTHLGLEGTRSISRIRVHPSDPDTVWVAAQGNPYAPSEERGIYRTRDGGATWEKVLYVSPSAGASELALDPSNPRILYAAFWDHERKPWEVRSGGPGSGLHRSTDGGDTWMPIVSGLPEPLGKLGIAVSADPRRLYAIVEADPGGGVYRSDDAGETWTLMADDWGLHSRAWYYIEVFADPKDPEVVWVLNAWVWRSIDGGRTFTRVPTPHGDNHDLWINPEDPRLMIEANDGGANVSLDGGKSWSTQENQPTAQFYRVATDDQFPYHVYGGQQDNSAIGIVSRTAGSGIGWKDWYEIAGCESAFVSLDRDDPRYVYAGCYMGLIGEWDRRTGLERDVMAWPALPASVPPRELRYRFNWNAPIVVSRHDPKVVYHAGNVVLKTEDRGRSWVEVSPDLTRDDPEKQGPGGRPITNEGAGGETYGTIAYLAESPHDPRVLWAGSDDGRVNVTRDGGETWTDVSPKELGESLVNAIEISPHDPETVYVAATRYKFGDLVPRAYKTGDGGRSWTSIAGGIPDGAWVRVVREDPERRGLLYMGTETGALVSFDGGGSWQSLQLDLPVTPVTDLQVAHGDLVASTAGRGFWILDDLEPLRQAAEAAAAEGAFLFAPRPAVRFFGGGFSGGGGGGGRQGQNPPQGAVIDFALDALPEEGVVALEILDAEGAVVRRYASAEKKEEEPPRPPERRPALQRPPEGAERPLEPKAGMNRVAWDLRHDAPTRVPGLYVFGGLSGRKAVPASYTVRLSAGETRLERPLEVVPDPRLEASDADYRAQARFVEAIDAEIGALHAGVLRLRAARAQIEAVAERAVDYPDAEALVAEARGFAERLTALEDALIQKRTVDSQTVINFESRLNHHMIFLRGAVDGSEGGVNESARQRWAELVAVWADRRAELDSLLGDELAAFNAHVREAALPAVVVGEVEEGH